MKMRTTLAAIVALALPAIAVGQQVETQEQQEQQRTQQRETEQPADRADRTPAGERRSAGFRGTETEQTRQLGQQEDQNQELVNYLAAKVKLANDCQIELASLAAEQAESQEVKEFANTLKEEHKNLNQQLIQAVPQLREAEGLSDTGSQREASRTGEPAQPGQSDQPQFGQTDRDEARQPGQPGQLGQAQPGQAERATARAQIGQEGQFLDGAAKKLLEITRQATESNKESVKQMLSEKQGKKFDMCFVGLQIGAHMWMEAELEAMQDVGPQQFTSVVQQAHSKVQDHLATAKDLGKKFEDETGSSGQASADEQEANPLEDF